MLKNLIKLFKDEEGATALEYGLMAAAVAGVLIVIAYFLGSRVSNAINNVAQHIVVGARRSSPVVERGQRRERVVDGGARRSPSGVAAWRMTHHALGGIQC